MNIKGAILLRVRIAFLIVTLFVMVVIYRLVDIQFVEGEHWRQRAEEMSFDYKTIEATRGNIYANNEELLATSLPFYRLAFDPSLVSNDIFKSNIDSLSHLLSIHFRDYSSDHYKKKISEARQSRSRYLILNRKLINYQGKQKMSEWPIFRLGQMTGGVIFERTDERHRPFRSLAQRTIGYYNDNVGVGIERSFNEYLAGKDGEGLFQRMAGNNWKPVNTYADIRPEDGFDVQTTIDVNLQDVAQSALLKAVTRFKASYGSVVLMEVKTGEIRAISNLTRTEQGTYAENYNHALGSSNDPGSTFKLASILALLEAGKVKLTDTVDTGEGSIDFYDGKFTLTDVKRGGYGKITVQEVFEKSSNVGIAKLVTEHFGDNPQEFIDIIKKTGYGKPIDFQLLGEGMPFIKDPSHSTWSGTSLPWISVGYETSLTPLQTLALYNAVANDGKMIQPIIVKSIKRADKTIENFEAKVLNKKIASKETIEKLKLMLDGVVQRGTAQNIKNEHYRIAGKTGTAQKLIDGAYRSQRYYASFAGYFPADDPIYSCIVVIDDPEGWNRYGGDVSAPVFKEIADMIYAKNLNIHDAFAPDLRAQEGTFPVIRAGKLSELNELCNLLGISNHYTDQTEEWVRSEVENNAIIWKTNHQDNGLVPNVQGMTLRDAIFILENAGAKVSISGKGRVVKQSVTPGTRINSATTIKLELG